MVRNVGNRLRRPQASVDTWRDRASGITLTDIACERIRRLAAFGIVGDS